MTIPNNFIAPEFNKINSKSLLLRFSILSLEQKKLFKKLAFINGKVTMKSFVAKFDMELFNFISNLHSRIL